MSEKKIKDELRIKVAEISEFLTELDCPYCSGDGCDKCDKKGIDKGALRANELLREVWEAVELLRDKEAKEPQLMICPKAGECKTYECNHRDKHESKGVYEKHKTKI